MPIGQAATMSEVQLATIMAPPSQSASEQMHRGGSGVRQHFCVATVGQDVDAIDPISADGNAEGDPHWQKDISALALHA